MKKLITILAIFFTLCGILVGRTLVRPHHNDALKSVLLVSEVSDSLEAMTPRHARIGLIARSDNDLSLIHI